jgi:hypothetical protein
MNRWLKWLLYNVDPTVKPHVHDWHYESSELVKMLSDQSANVGLWKITWRCRSCKDTMAETREGFI